MNAPEKLGGPSFENYSTVKCDTLQSKLGPKTGYARDSTFSLSSQGRTLMSVIRPPPYSLQVIFVLRDQQFTISPPMSYVVRSDSIKKENLVAQLNSTYATLNISTQ